MATAWLTLGSSVPSITLCPSTESCLLPPFTRRNALFELDSRILELTAWTSPSPSLYLKRVMLTPAVYPANGLFELDSRMATAWHHPLIPLP